MYVPHPTKPNTEIFRDTAREKKALAAGYNVTIYGKIVTKPRTAARTGTEFCSGFGFDEKFRYLVDYRQGKFIPTSQLYTGPESEIE